MEPRRFELVPAVASDVAIHIEDDRASRSPNDDLIEIGFRAERHDGFAFSVALSIDEVVRLRNALSEIIKTPLP
jgi:hypothetical protein